MDTKTRTVGASNEDYLGIQEIPAIFYEVDVVLLDRYQGFSAEVVRIALLGIAALGFFLEKLLSKAPDLSNYSGLLIRGFWAFSAGLFAAAACAGLLHRYYSADGIHHHLRAVRSYVRAGHQKTDAVNANGDEATKRYKLSGCWLLVAGTLLAFGATAAGIAVSVLTLTIEG